MRHVRQLAIAIGLLGLAISLCFGASRGAYAQSLAGPGADSGSDDVSTKKGLAQVIDGAKAYKAGKSESAVSALSTAISSGGLSSRDLAKAFYFRGLSYRRLKKPAEAIADLTSAVWLKGGLSETERGDALKNRSAAYKDAGINEPETTVAASKSAGPPASVAPAKTSASSGASGGLWQTATQATPSTTGVDTAKVSSSANSVSPTTALVPLGAPSDATTSSQAASADASPSSGTSNPLSGVGTFFSNMFGGGSTPSQVTTGTTGTASNAATATTSADLSSPSTGQVSAVSGWSSETKVAAVAPSTTTQPSKVARTTVVPKTKPKSTAPSGRYQVRLAAVRSQEEAQTIAATFAQKHASALDGRKPQITTQAFGNMGTFYNVQVGPFSREKDFAPLCVVAQAGGYDCLVVKK